MVGAFLIGCTVLLVVGCAGVRSGVPTKEDQGHTEATKEQTRSPEATASEEARCEGTRTIKQRHTVFTTNDLPGCPKGGLLSGTDGPDKLFGGEGDDEIRSHGAADLISGGSGNDVIYGGPGDDLPLVGGAGDDVVYGGPGDDGDLIDGGGGDDLIYGGPGYDAIFTGGGREHNKFYCGEGRDAYLASKGDYVSSSCEENMGLSKGVP